MDPHGDRMLVMHRPNVLASAISKSFPPSVRAGSFESEKAECSFCSKTHCLVKKCSVGGGAVSKGL